MAPRMRSDLRHGRTDHDGQSSNCKSKIFAGGDAVRGADLAVRAFADGRDAAEEILRTLTPNMN